jgi:hypothetical protein
MEDFKTYLQGVLNRRIIRFIDLHFRARGIKNPTIEQICEITEDEMMNSWLSVVSMKEFLLFQQQIKENGVAKD